MSITNKHIKKALNFYFECIYDAKPRDITNVGYGFTYSPTITSLTLIRMCSTSEDTFEFNSRQGKLYFIVQNEEVYYKDVLDLLHPI